jgi:coronatine-insensitive protein 1
MLAGVSWKQAHNVLGDQGLKVLWKTCKELRRLWVEDDDAGYISHSGVVAISQGCAKLRYMALYVYDITNVALAMVGLELSLENTFT